MIKALCVGLIAIASVGMASSQVLTEDRSIMLSQDQPGGLNVILGLKQTMFYLGDPSVSVPAIGRAGVTPTASRFTVRAWQEGDTARVVIYASVLSATGSDLEVVIGTYSLRTGGTVRVTETEKFGASPVVLRMVRRLPRR